MHEIKTEIDIQSTPDRLWSILTNFPAHSSWNPFIRSIEGPVQTGGRLTVSIQPAGGKPMTFHPTVLGLAKATLERGTRAGFVAMNQALKTRAENRLSH
jgi:uncharacterized protein YndB with AHSA1/START domain